MMYSKLTYEQIDNTVAEAASFLEQERMVDKEVTRTRLMLEETLLNYRDALGEEGEFSMNCKLRLGSLRIELNFPGEQLDLSGDNGESEVMRGILAQQGYAPTWQYRNRVNQVVFTPRKPQPSQVRMLLVAIEMAVLFGFWGKILPASVGNFLTAELLTPMFETFMGLVSAVAGPLIFLAVVWGIYSIGDTATLGRIGKRMITRFLLMSLLTAVITAGVLVFFFPVSYQGGAVIGFRDVLNLILGMAPDNFLTPFTQGNPVQIIFIAALVGIAMLLLEGKIPVAAGFMEQSNRITQRIMEMISKLIPFFVFSSIFSMIVGGNFASLIGIGKLLLFILMGDAVISLFYLVLISLRWKVSLGLLLKKALPTTIIGFATASSSAALASNLETCQKELGIDQKIVNFGVPLGQVVFMPGCIVMFLTVSLYMANLYGVEITVARLLTAIIIAVMLSIATPPVPGGGLTCYTMLFVQMGIPLEGIGLLITFNIILEFIGTGANLFTLQMELTELAGELKLLNLDRLRKKH